MNTKNAFLSKDDVAAFCRTPQRARQLAFLRKNGIRHYVDCYGWPVVLWSALEKSADKESHHKAWKSNKVA